MQRAAGLGMSSAECITSGDGTFLPRMVAGSVGVCRVLALQVRYSAHIVLQML